MHAHTALRTLLVLAGLSLTSRLLAQTEPPSVGDLKEEQRIINNAYLQRGENYVQKAKEQFTDNLLRPATENGLYAAELLSRARNLMDKHPSRIEQARNIFGGRASESSREDLRRNLREQIDPRFFNLQERLETLANLLVAKGDKTLQMAIGAAKRGDTQKVVEIMAGSGLASLEPAPGPVKPDTSANTPSPAPAAPAAAAASTALPGGGNATQSGGSVSINGFSVPGQLQGDKVTGSPYGTINLASEQTNSQGTRFYQTDKGVLVVPPGNLIAGATLNKDGTITLSDGSKTSINNIDSATGAPKATPARPPAGVKLVGDNGPVTDDPSFGPFENGEQKGVRKEYLGGKGAALVSETQVTRKLIQASDTEWKVKDTLGQSRSWDLSIKMGEPKSSNGTVELTLTLVDGGGSTAFTATDWQITDDKGNRATVTPSSGNPAEAVATITKGGDYTFTVSGKTDWGSPFRITGKSSIYP